MPDFSDEAEVTRMAKRDARVALLARRRALPAADAGGRRRARPGRAGRPGTPAAPAPDDGVRAGRLRAGRRRTCRRCCGRRCRRTAELLLPVLRADLDLDWAAYTGPGCAGGGRAGLREPAGARLGPAGGRARGLVVVPALAVDRRGLRLGRGGGSYDRALARVPAAALTVALLHDGELVEALPAEPHDRPVRAVDHPRRRAAYAGGPVRGCRAPHFRWTNPGPMTHHWHSNTSSANWPCQIRRRTCPRTSTPAPRAVTSSRRCSPSPTSR